MQAQVDIITLTVLPDGTDACLIPGIQGVGGWSALKST
jgi:hypothetical protein